MTAPAGIPANPELVTLTIDGLEVSVPKGTLIIRAAEELGIEIPRFCDHPLLDPVGACRQCLVEVEGQNKPIASCTTPVVPDMVVLTQLTSKVAAKAQEGTIEFLLLNHPLDCPVCDKGGECPLQNQAMAVGRPESRLKDSKLTFPKPIPLSSQVLLDRERCVRCARCTRFQAEIAGDPFIELFERGALEQVAIYRDEPFKSYFSGNTVQICPVGALTGTAYRFRARPYDLVSTPTSCEHCASGCAMRTDWRRRHVLRRLAGDDPEVNEEWNCDKGRWAFTYAWQPDRLGGPLVRDDATGELETAAWLDAIRLAARSLAETRDRRGVGVLTGGRLPVEDAYAYAKFARVALGTNDIDFRARPHSSEETEFLTSVVAGTGLGVTYRELEAAPAVLLAGFEPEEESPIVFLRLRKAARRRGLRVFSAAACAAPSLTKGLGTLLPTTPGGEAALLDALAGDPATATVDTDTADTDSPLAAAAAALRRPGAVILAGERLAQSPGALSAAVRLAAATSARLAWVPRRAGERGALDAGAFPTLLPGGRPLADPGARADLSGAWGVEVPSAPGRDTDAILRAALDGELDALVVAGVDPADLPDPALARAAMARVPLLVSLELRRSAVTELADIVLPVASVMEKSGTFYDWEGRPRPFEQALDTPALPDLRVLDLIADEMGRALGLPDVATARRELAALGLHRGARPPAPAVTPPRLPVPGPGEALLASWTWLLDAGRMQDGEPHLAGTARTPCLQLSPATAAEVGAAEGELVTVSSERGSLVLPLVLADMPDRVAWVPTNAPGYPVRERLAAGSGAVVRLSRAQVPEAVAGGAHGAAATGAVTGATSASGGA
jgi:NADH-quinone oxidoreductase subunit G